MSVRTVVRYVIGLHSSYYTDRPITHPLSTATNFIRSNFIYHLFSILPFELLVFAFTMDASCKPISTRRNLAGGAEGDRPPNN